LSLEPKKSKLIDKMSMAGGYLNLPKPFEALCDYEESDSESESELNANASSDLGKDNIDRAQVNCSEVQSCSNSNNIEKNDLKDSPSNLTSALIRPSSDNKLNDESSSESDEESEVMSSKVAAKNAQNTNWHLSTNSLSSKSDKDSNNPTFDKKSFFKLKAQEFQTTSAISEVPKSASQIREKMRQLEMMKNTARKLNHAAVVEEDRVSKQPANWQALQKKNEWMLYEDERKKECSEQGKEWDRVKVLSVQADEAERMLSRKKKKNPDTGFASFEQASYRQYNRLTRQMTLDKDAYAAHKEEVGVEAQHVDSMYHGTHKPSEAAVERMVGDLDKQIAKRAKFSRRRTFIEDRDVDYINERNAKFNKKIERFYGEYTAEIKQNLERGTAI